MGVAGGLGGPAAAGLTAGSTFSRRGSAEFEVGQTTRSEVIAAIQNSGKFQVKENGPADAELKLRITGYGFY